MEEVTGRGQAEEVRSVMCGFAQMVPVVVLRVVSHWSLVPIPCPRVGASCACQVSRFMTVVVGGQ